MNTANIKQNNKAITITEEKLPTGIVFKTKEVIHNVNNWHKFIITTSSALGRDVILRAILDHVHPLDLIPVSFSQNGNQSSFLARNCGAAVEKLCKDNLTIANPGEPRPFKLSIILKFATTQEFKIDVQKNIMHVLAKKFNPITRTLNLIKFHDNPELTEFCPLSQPKIMFFVLHLSKTLQPVEKYLMGDNRIKILNPLETLLGTKISSLDLRNNLIDDLANLAPIKGFKLTEIVLDSNPLCAKYDRVAYLQGVKSFLPTIEKLDDVSLTDGEIPRSSVNFLSNPKGYDIVNQFLEYFFTAYDSRNRKVMLDLYHKNATFSLTSHYIVGQISSATALLRNYNNISRNLLKMADFSKTCENIFKGNVAIINLFAQLPSTEHDPYSFNVDLVLQTEDCAVIVVNGVFRELPDNLLDPERVFGFSRTFVLNLSMGGHEMHECCIVNEQLQVYNSLSSQQTKAFQISKPLRLNAMPPVRTMKEQQQVAETLKIITSLNTDWSKKCLEECNYDLKRALGLFVDLYKSDSIPPEAFHCV